MELFEQMSRGLRSDNYRNSPRKSYVTQLAPQERPAFENWVRKNKVPYDPSPEADYDMPGFWKALQMGDKRAASGIAPDGKLHFTDFFKTPYHKTFSNESKYSTNKSDPQWRDNILYQYGNIVADENQPWWKY